MVLLWYDVNFLLFVDWKGVGWGYVVMGFYLFLDFNFIVFIEDG